MMGIGPHAFRGEYRIQPGDQRRVFVHETAARDIERIGLVIVDCTGINPIPQNTTNPALRSLFDNGLARVDPLGIGLNSTIARQSVDRANHPPGSSRSGL
jgi:uncharacterized NAD(P)/FAD-binding protein YdhS